jgi:hypothetical protein
MSSTEWWVLIGWTLAVVFFLYSLVKHQDVVALKDDLIRYRRYHERFIAVFVWSAKEHRRVCKKYNRLRNAVYTENFRYSELEELQQYIRDWDLGDFSHENNLDLSEESVDKILEQDKIDRLRIGYGIERDNDPKV